MPKYKYPLANGKHLVIDSDTEPDDTELEGLAKEQGVQLKVDDGFRQEAPVDTSIPASLKVPFKQENQYIPPPTPAKTGIARGWELANKPVTDYLPPEWQPGNVARKVSDWITTPVDKPDSLWESSPRLRGFVGGALEGIGDFAAGITSPINVATAVASGGAGLAAKAGLTNLARVARGAETVAGGAMVGHGGSEIIRPDATLAERAQGLFEAAGGGGAIIHGLSGPPVIKPKVAPLPDESKFDLKTEEGSDLQTQLNYDNWKRERDDPYSAYNVQKDLEFRTGTPNQPGEILPVHGPDPWPTGPVDPSINPQYGPVDNPEIRLSEIAARARGKRIAASLPAEEAHPFGDVTDFTPIPKPRISAAQAAQNLRTGGNLFGSNITDVPGQFERSIPRAEIDAAHGEVMGAVQPGMTRMYTGGANKDLTSKQWFTSDQEYAKAYADKSGGSVDYIDVPTDHPLIKPDYPEQGIAQGFHTSAEFPADMAGRRIPVSEIPNQTPLKWGDDPQRIREFRKKYERHVRESKQQGRTPLNPKEFQNRPDTAHDLMDDFMGSQRKGPVPAGEPYYGPDGEIIGYTTDSDGSTGIKYLNEPDAREFSNQVIPDEAADWQSDPNRERKYGNKFGRGRAVPEIVPQEQGLQRFSNQVVDDGRVLIPELTDAGAPPLPVDYTGREGEHNLGFTKDIERMERERISRDNDPRLQPERDARIAQNQQQSETQAALNIQEGDFRVSNEFNAARIPDNQLTPEQAAIKASYDNIRAHDDVYGRKFSEAEELLPEGEFYKPPREVAARHRAEQDALKDTHHKLVDEYKQNQQFADQVIPESNILKPRRIDPNIVDVEPTLANKRPEGVTVKKGKDFSNDGNWEVTLSNGKTVKIFRDPESKWWYVDNVEEASRNPSTGKPRTTASSKNEMIQKVNERYGNEGSRQESTSARPDEANDSPIRDKKSKIGPVKQRLHDLYDKEIAGKLTHEDLIEARELTRHLNDPLADYNNAENIFPKDTDAYLKARNEMAQTLRKAGYNVDSRGNATKKPEITISEKAAQVELERMVGGKRNLDKIQLDNIMEELQTILKKNGESSVKPQRDTAEDTGAQSTSKPAVPLKDSIVIPHGQRTNTLINEMRGKGYKFAGQDAKGDAVFHKSDDPIPVSTNAVPIVRRIKDIEPEKAGIIRELWNAPRGMMSVDLPFITSAGLRQALPLVGTKAWFKAWAPSIKSYGSKKFYDTHAELLKADPLMQRSMRPVLTSQGKPLIQGGRPVMKEMPSIMEQAGVKLNDLSNFSGREEAIRSTLPEKIPGYGKLIAANNRAYSAFLNDLRVSTFRNFYDAMPNKNDIVALKQLGDAVGTFTGRGKLETKIPFTMDPKTGTHRMMTMDRHAGALAEVLFAPRLVASRLQMINPVNYTMLTRQAKIEYTKAALRTAGAWASMASLGYLAGAEVSLDPRSADFGKMKWGNFRMDAAAGIQQLLVLGARMATGETTSSTTGRTFELGQGFGNQSEWDVFENFVSNKLQPNVKYMYDFWDADEKKPFAVVDRAISLAVPMMSDTLIEIAKSEPELLPGIAKAAMLAPLASAGIGMQSYSKDQPYGKSRVLAPALGMMGVNKPEQYDIMRGGK